MWSHEGAGALEYLRDKRGISDSVIKDFKFGYCPRHVDHELRGRIIMPCFDVHNQLIALTTRDIEAPKRYSHWHESFDKSNHLFGVNLAKQYIRKYDRVIVVEGQFDVTALHTYNLKMTVGLFGTSLSIMHVALLSRYCSDIYIMLDPDVVKSDGSINTSGKDATVKAMNLYHQHYLQNHGINFIPVTLPDELDPDEYVIKYGKKSLTDLLDRRKQEVMYG